MDDVKTNSMGFYVKDKDSIYITDEFLEIISDTVLSVEESLINHNYAIYPDVLSLEESLAQTLEESGYKIALMPLDVFKEQVNEELKDDEKLPEILEAIDEVEEAYHKMYPDVEFNVKAIREYLPEKE